MGIRSALASKSLPFHSLDWFCASVRVDVYRQTAVLTRIPSHVLYAAHLTDRRSDSTGSGEMSSSNVH